MLKGHLQWITWLSWQPLHRYIICGSRICLYHPKLNFQRGWRGSKQNTSLNGLENNKGWILFVLFFSVIQIADFLLVHQKWVHYFLITIKFWSWAPIFISAPTPLPPLLKQTSTLSNIKDLFVYHCYLPWLWEGSTQWTMCFMYLFPWLWI